MKKVFKAGDVVICDFEEGMGIACIHAVGREVPNKEGEVIAYMVDAGGESPIIIDRKMTEKIFTKIGEL